MSEETIPRLLYGIDRTAAMLDCGRSAVYGLIDSGQLTRVKLGRRSLITAESLSAYVQRLTAKVGSGEPADDVCEPAQ